jgi:enoyl-CoA hydratase/carnithine racemase
MLDTIRHDAITELRLARPPVNALDPELVAQLRAAIQSAPSSGARGLVLSGRRECSPADSTCRHCCNSTVTR